PYSSWFDLADHQEIVLPILGQRIDQCIDDDELIISDDGGPDGGPVLRYYAHVVPLRPGTERLPLEELLALQHYRLAYWKVASEELNYRRFFDVDTLVAVRVENVEVFTDSHAVIVRLMTEGLVQGLRVDHPDGLADPIGYLRRLNTATPGDSWIVIEKILAFDERMQEDLLCDGTTGYDALQRIGGLFVDPAGKAVLTTAFAEMADVTTDWTLARNQAKRAILNEVLIAEVDRLARSAHEICQADVRLRDYSLRGLAEAITEILVAFSVYRAYVMPGHQPTEPNLERIGSAILTAIEVLPDRLSELELLHQLITGQHWMQGRRDLRNDFCVRFQQVCGAVMAKGVEDTANYRWFPLSALCEVGGEADRFGVTPAEFHRWATDRQANWPFTMNALSTHDTKRSEDVRARLAALSEIPGEWVTTVHALRGIAGGLKLPADDVLRDRRQPDRNNRRRRLYDVNLRMEDGATEWLLWQTMVGAWPIGAERLKAYMIKAVREAKLHTSWSQSNASYEAALCRYIDALMENAELIAAVEQVAERLHPAFVTNCLGQRAIQLMAPGVPDIYGGAEMVSLHLVDPDNRYPLDHELLAGTLQDALSAVPRPGDDLDGAKSRLTALGLHLRRRHPDAVGRDGSYTVLPADGHAADHVVAFLRGDRLAAVATRLPMRLIAKGGWSGTALRMPPGTWRNVLNDELHTCRTGDDEGFGLPELLAGWPVALLEKIG
ncbi:MAG: malto-oligosyltrehalose synthase, partial [Actinomycetes bacterium]